MRKYLLIFMGLLLSLVLTIGACAPAQPSPAPSPAPSPSPSPKPSPTPSPSLSAADFYKNNTVTIMVPYAPGGTVDYPARLIASYWPDTTGGNMIVKNDPSGGNLQAVNTVYNAKPDGLTIGIGLPGAQIVGPSLMGIEGVKFDARKFGYIALFGRAQKLLAVGANTPYKSMSDLQKAEKLVFGATSATGGAALGGVVVIELFGLTNAKVVSGYGGTGELGLAALKGEVQGYSFGAQVILDHIGKGWVKPPLLTLDFERSPEWFPDAPAVPELLKLTPEQEGILRFFAASQEEGRIFFTAPGIPSDRLQYLRDTFAKILANSGFLTQAKMAWPVWTKPLTGDQTGAAVEKAMSMTKEDITRFNALVDKHLK